MISTTSSTKVNKEGERREHESRSDKVKSAGGERKLDLKRQLIIAQTEKVIAETRLMEVKARYRPILVFSIVVWVVVFAVWAVVLIA